VFTYTCFPSLYKYLLLAQIDNNNIHSYAHFGYVHHMNNTISQSGGLGLGKQTIARAGLRFD
jgi:hypothetical protein